MVKTIKSYMNQIKKLSQISVKDLKGYEKLTDRQKNVLFFLEGELHNFRDIEM